MQKKKLVQKIRKILLYNDANKGLTPDFLLYLTSLTKAIHVRSLRNYIYSFLELKTVLMH